jgi:flagellar basal body rod protein FlgB
MSQPVMFDSTFNTLENQMLIATKRQEVIAQNIANAKTPGYEAMTFDEQLMQAVKRMDRKEVVLEDELAALTENSVKYSAYVKWMTSKLSALRAIVTQGKK